MSPGPEVAQVHLTFEQVIDHITASWPEDARDRMRKAARVFTMVALKEDEAEALTTKAFWMQDRDAYHKHRAALKRHRRAAERAYREISLLATCYGLGAVPGREEP